MRNFLTSVAKFEVLLIVQGTREVLTEAANDRCYLGRTKVEVDLEKLLDLSKQLGMTKACQMLRF